MFCHNCGKQYKSSNSSFCSGCGYKRVNINNTSHIRYGGNNQIKSFINPAKNMKLIILIVAGVMAIILTILVIIQIFGSSDHPLVIGSSGHPLVGHWVAIQHSDRAVNQMIQAGTSRTTIQFNRNGTGVEIGEEGVATLSSDFTWTAENGWLIMEYTSGMFQGATIRGEYRVIGDEYIFTVPGMEIRYRRLR